MVSGTVVGVGEVLNVMETERLELAIGVVEETRLVRFRSSCKLLGDGFVGNVNGFDTMVIGFG